VHACVGAHGSARAGGVNDRAHVGRHLAARNGCGAQVGAGLDGPAIGRVSLQVGMAYTWSWTKASL